VLPEGAPAGSLGESLEFQTILNEFDADYDGWAELSVSSFPPGQRDYHLAFSLLRTGLGTPADAASPRHSGAGIVG
jgi:hypothetical protein